MSGKLLLLGAVLLFGLGIFVEAFTLPAQSRSESAAATIEPQVLHQHIDLKAMPEQNVGDLF
jgi:hypothetical protein